MAVIVRPAPAEAPLEPHTVVCHTCAYWRRHNESDPIPAHTASGSCEQRMERSRHPASGGFAHPFTAGMFGCTMHVPFDDGPEPA